MNKSNVRARDPRRPTVVNGSTCACQMGRALRAYSDTLKYFETFESDLFDFHLYSLRKGMLRAYLRLIEWCALVICRFPATAAT